MPAVSFVDLGLPELPLTTKSGDVEADLRYLYFAVQNLAYAVGQKVGLDEPATGFESDISYTMGSYKRRLFLPCLEAITYGQLVHTVDDGFGVFSVQLADATDATKPCHGICNSTAGGAIGEVIEIVMPNAYVSSIGGLTHGVIYYLDTVPGGGTNTPPATSGNIVQAVGLALSADEFFFNPPYHWDVVP